MSGKDNAALYPPVRDLGVNFLNDYSLFFALKVLIHIISFTTTFNYSCTT
jgi:hypothetical protein